MSNLFVLVGLPASGKSTLADHLSVVETASILSSDEIRKELYGDETIQTDPSKVFEIMNNRAKDLLEHGKNVIYDATNINRKRRKHLINHVLKANKKYVYYMNKHVADTYYFDMDRNRVVGMDVIDKMYKTLQIPVKNEGWDNVFFISENKQESIQHRAEVEDLIRNKPDHDKLFSYLQGIINDFSLIHDLPQDSKYHSFSVSSHTYHVYTYLYDQNASLELLWASLFHDLGKSKCKSFVNFKGEETRYASFIGHEYVSSQLAAYHLNKLGYDDQFVKDVSALCQFHMYPMNAGEKKMKEVQNLLGDGLFSDLMLLHEADMNAK